ncbi:MAG: MgtC/SapB family protein, partial [Rhodospirillaceae bacterium]|nr:MgtC/SapB family protein [Rhodospirillaceae bacterium]
METLAGYDMVGRLALALGIGLLVGVERGRHTREQSGGMRVAGVRTFSLIGLLGGVWGLLGTILGDVVLGITFMGFAALVLFAYRA